VQNGKGRNEGLKRKKKRKKLQGPSRSRKPHRSTTCSTGGRGRNAKATEKVKTKNREDFFRPYARHRTGRQNEQKGKVLVALKIQRAKASARRRHRKTGIAAPAVSLRLTDFNSRGGRARKICKGVEQKDLDMRPSALSETPTKCSLFFRTFSGDFPIKRTKKGDWASSLKKTAAQACPRTGWGTRRAEREGTDWSHETVDQTEFTPNW